MVGTDIEVKDINVSYVGSTTHDDGGKATGKSTFNQNTERQDKVQNAIMVDVQDKSDQKDEPEIQKDEDRHFMKIEELGYQMRDVDIDMDYIADPEDDIVDSCLTLSQSQSRLLQRSRSRSRTPNLNDSRNDHKQDGRESN